VKETVELLERAVGFGQEQSSVSERSQITPKQMEQMGQAYIQANGDKLFLSLNTNPVELSALITALVATLFVLFFGFRTETIRERLPSLESLDGLINENEKAFEIMAEQGIGDYYNQGDDKRKLRLAPLLGELQSRMLGGRRR